MEPRRTRRERCEDPEACSGLGVVPGCRNEGPEWGNWRLVWGQRALFCKRVPSITQQNGWAFLVSVMNANHAPAVVPQVSPPVLWEKSPKDPFLPAGLQGLRCAAYMKLREFESDWKEEA